jgi:cytochrome c
MKSIIVSMVTAAGLVIAGSALAVDMPADVKAKCGACHAIDKKSVGPSLTDTANKYKGDKDAASKLAANIAKGGSYGWNMGKMPPKGMGATDAEIKSMSAFIVGLAK